MMKHVIHINKTCMDCGKDFVAIIEKESGKPLNCWYWGTIDSGLKYQWFIKLDFDNLIDNNKPMWQRWLREYLPGYCYPSEEPTVKPIYRRWYLLLRKRLDRTPEIEMWTCPDCKDEGG